MGACDTDRGAKFTVGQLVVHQRFGYRGVVVDVFSLVLIVAWIGAFALLR